MSHSRCTCTVELDVKEAMCHITLHNARTEMGVETHLWIGLGLGPQCTLIALFPAQCTKRASSVCVCVRACVRVCVCVTLSKSYHSTVSMQVFICVGVLHEASKCWNNPSLSG